MAVNVSGLNIDDLEPRAETAGATRAYVDEGAHLTANALTLSATATNDVTVDTTLVGIAGIIITYANQTAKNTHEVDVYMGPRAGVAETGGLSGVINVNDAITGNRGFDEQRNH